MIRYDDDSLALHTDLYEIIMAYTYWKKGNADKKAVFEVYYRENPFRIHYNICAVLECIVDYINNLTFTDSDLEYLKNEIGFEEEFVEYLRHWKFRGTIRSMHEGEIASAEEPLMQVEGPILDCQIIETALLNVINYQTL